MSKNRKEAEKIILELVEDLLPGSPNTERYKNLFKSMSDQDFDKYMKYLRDGNLVSIVEELQGKYRLSTERNLKLAKKYDVKFMNHIVIPTEDGDMITPLPYMTVKLLCRRLSQTLTKKIKVAYDNATVDQLTGQRVNKSKGSAMSYPQLQLGKSQGAKLSLLELIKARGGDEEMYRAMEQQIAETGKVRISELPNTGRVKATETLSIFWKSVHIDNNI